MAEDPAPTRADGALLRITDDGALTRGGAPHRILSGAMHYFRVHPGQWRDRIRRLVDMGLNTVDTYIAWNFHQPDEGRPADFGGWRDVEEFISLAGQEGLDVIVRPGPYICAEWTNGGLPSWFTRRTAAENGVGRRRLALRSSDPGFTGPVARWFDELIPRIAALQASQGGPVVAVQVENEYGSYGDDAGYLTWLRTVLIERGINELLYTADGPTELMLDGGTLDGTLAAVTLGSGAAAARELQRSRRPGEPFLAAEFWGGWFDHWGEKHHVRDAASASAALSEILDAGSVSIYMAHGGTNFGLWAGSNEDHGRIQPTVTSYDSDAPIGEDGRLTPKFDAFREALGATGPVRSRTPRFLPETSAPLLAASDLLGGLLVTGMPTARTPAPASFEQLRLNAGISVHLSRPVLPHGRVPLRLTDLADRATLFVDGQRVGSLEGPGEITVEGHGARVDLHLVVGPTVGSTTAPCWERRRACWGRCWWIAG
ncbi:glycoside hydrolase family 35 protein [Acidipropionibacterium virtanenii]|uniref:Beta-galactosidase n=1 Tax=Acidipropionibacterium virtanenii TaxID=2057246 RepID=A0A344UX30_9ACTN|nr:beta-galactosidase family protein [Acidipropionibacterium virtanenii]AXE39828.1 Beta-galactosidase [Acidipropionibacterium virtanenii]